MQLYIFVKSTGATRPSALHCYDCKELDIGSNNSFVLVLLVAEMWADVCLITLFVISDNSNVGLIRQ